MKKRNLIFIMFALISVFGIMFASSVKAYEENPFGNEECITDYTWLKTARLTYSLNQSTGKFETSGKTADEYRTDSSNDSFNVVFYDVSTDGQTLYAYVPSYKNTLTAEIARNMVSQAGINIGADCENVLKVSKTVLGDSSNNNDDSSTDDSGTVEKKLTPNTASPFSIAATTTGIILVCIAGYILLKKNNKIPFNKIK